MAYSTKPHIPKVRMEAVRLVEAGWTVRDVARHLGYTHSALVKWVARSRTLPHSLRGIPTQSSRSRSHAHALPPTVVTRILHIRQERNECAEIIQHRLGQEGIIVSLSHVKRVLRRYRTRRYSRWEKWHQYPPRPLPAKPGILVQIDTIHDGLHDNRLFSYTMLDVCSRWAYTLPTERITSHRSLRFVKGARRALPFTIRTLQSDHGSAFSKWFTKQVASRGIAHRHSRIRTSNDNAHLERFNRTIQEQCINRIPRRLTAWHREITDYLEWYNERRPHIGLKMKSPIGIINAVPRY